MGAKASLAGGPGGGTLSPSPSSSLGTSPTLENIQAAYEDGQRDAALELLRQACCVECTLGTARLQGVSGPSPGGVCRTHDVCVVLEMGGGCGCSQKTMRSDCLLRTTATISKKETHAPSMHARGHGHGHAHAHAHTRTHLKC